MPVLPKLSLVLLPLLAAPAVHDAAPVTSVQATNHALSEAVRCTTRTEPTPFEGCAPLELRSQGRVRFPASGNASRPQEWTAALELRLNDGSWLHLEEMHRDFHGMVWVPEVGLYVGYAAWYGEEGGTVMVDPEDGALRVVRGIPQLTPDGSLMLVTEVDAYDEGGVRVGLFRPGSSLPEALWEGLIPAEAAALNRVVFVPATRRAVIYVMDWKDQSQAVTVDLSAHWAPPSPDLLSVTECEKSKNARYVTGDQVYLRAGPSEADPVVSALPWGSCVEVDEVPGDWRLVRIADQQGFVDGTLLADKPPAGRPKAVELHPNAYCQAHPVAPMYGEMAVRAAQAANRAGGLPDYYIVPQYDDRCVALRPAESPLSEKPLGELERVVAPDLNMRLAAWTLALAPESAYRKHGTAAVLNASHLARPHPETHSPNVNTKLPGVTWGHLAQVFDAPELDPPASPAAGVHLLQIVPEQSGVLLPGFKLNEALGITGGGFPAGRFTVTEDLSRVVFDRSLPAAALDPCTGELLQTRLEGVAYDPATGTVRGHLDALTHGRLLRCAESIPAADYPQLRFVLLVDETPNRELLEVVSGPAERRLAQEGQSERYDAVELRWATRGATLRSVVYGDCGVHAIHIFQFHNGLAWQRVQVEASDWWDCGL